MHICTPWITSLDYRNRLFTDVSASGHIFHQSMETLTFSDTQSRLSVCHGRCKNGPTSLEKWSPFHPPFSRQVLDGWIKRQGPPSNVSCVGVEFGLVWMQACISIRSPALNSVSRPLATAESSAAWDTTLLLCEFACSWLFRSTAQPSVLSSSQGKERRGESVLYLIGLRCGREQSFQVSAWIWKLLPCAANSFGFLGLKEKVWLF